MQTFMPYGGPDETAAVLDDTRLNKQRVEAKQILQVLTGETEAWRNHPAVVMWRGHSSGLVEYGYAMCLEWERRGGRDRAGLSQWFREHRDEAGAGLPGWVADGNLQLSHRSNLIRKDPDHYAPHFPQTRPDMPYLWPEWDGVARLWLYRISKAEARRSGWVLPDDLTYEPQTRLVRMVV